MKKSRIETVTIQSQCLGKEMKAQVYLPKSYNTSERFPVLYFLHGRNGNENILFEVELNKAADKMIDQEKIKPIIIVCPRIENSHGMNSSTITKEIPDPCDSNRKIHFGMYEDYIVKEVVSAIDSSFSTIADRSGRYIGGVSGGGYAALHNAFRHQDIFSKVGGHMPAIELELEEEDKPYYSSQDIWEKYDSIHIANSQDILDTDVYLDCGDNDEARFYRGCSILHEILKSKGISSQNHIYHGNHNLEYVKSNIEKYLDFYAKLPLRP
ncbi:MAG: esterase [Eubacterium sp.]|jgi:enterochelin esterase-like enzyme|nr:esterase [Eubacterium sp.]